MKTIIDFYKGAYGPTIIISVKEKDWLIWFRNEIAKLKESNSYNINLIDGERVFHERIVSVRILKSNEHLLLRTKTKNKTDAVFMWYLDDEKIEDIIDSVDNLIYADGPGHYYFHEGRPALVEFSYKE